MLQTDLETTWSVTLSKSDVQEITYSLGVGDQEPAAIELFYNDALPGLNSPDPVPDKKLACPSNNGLTSPLGTITAATGQVNTLTGFNTDQNITAPNPPNALIPGGQGGLVSTGGDPVPGPFGRSSPESTNGIGRGRPFSIGRVLGAFRRPWRNRRRGTSFDTRHESSGSASLVGSPMAQLRTILRCRSFGFLAGCTFKVVYVAARSGN